MKDRTKRRGAGKASHRLVLAFVLCAVSTIAIGSGLGYILVWSAGRMSSLQSDIESYLIEIQNLDNDVPHG